MIFESKLKEKLRLYDLKRKYYTDVNETWYVCLLYFELKEYHPSLFSTLRLHYEAQIWRL